MGARVLAALIFIIVLDSPSLWAEDALDWQTENSLVNSTRPNYFFYRTTTHNSGTKMEDHFKVHQNYGRTFKVTAEYHRPQYVKSERATIQMHSQFKWGRLLAVTQSQDKEINMIGADFKVRSSILKSRIVLAQHFIEKPLLFNPFVYLQSGFEFLSESEINVIYKKSPDAFKDLSISPFNISNRLQFLLNRTFLKDWRLEWIYHKGESDYFQSEIRMNLEDGNHWKWEQTQWEWGRSKWTLQYNHLSNPIYLYVARLDWIHLQDEAEEQLGMSHTLKIRLSRPLAVVGSFRMMRAETINTKNLRLGFQMDKDPFEAALEWRNYDPEQYRDQLTVALQYRWN